MWRTNMVLTVGTEMLHMTICTVLGYFMSLSVWGRIHVSWSLGHTKVQVVFQIVRQTATDTLHHAYDKFKTDTAGFFKAPRNQLELLELLLP